MREPELLHSFGVSPFALTVVPHGDAKAYVVTKPKRRPDEVWSPSPCTYLVDTRNRSCDLEASPAGLDERLTAAYALGNGQLLVWLSGAAALWTPATCGWAPIKGKFPSHSHLSHSMVGSQLHLWLNLHDSGSAAGFDYETNHTWCGVLDLPSATLVQPFARRVDADIRDAVVTADDVAYVRYYGRHRDKIARVPNSYEAARVSRRTRGPYELDLRLPFDGPFSLLGRGADGHPLVLARKGTGEPKGVALVRLETASQGFTILGSYQQGANGAVTGAVARDGSVVLLTHKSRRGGCVVRRWSPDGSDLVSVVEWSGDWNWSSAVAFVGDTLVLARGDGLYVAEC